MEPITSDPSLAALLAEIEPRITEFSDCGKCADVYAFDLQLWCDYCLLAAAARALREQQEAINQLQPPSDWKLPLQFDGDGDLLGADNRLLVWDGDVGERTGRYFAKLVNGIAALVSSPAERQE